MHWTRQEVSSLRALVDRPLMLLAAVMSSNQEKPLPAGTGVTSRELLQAQQLVLATSCQDQCCPATRRAQVALS